MSVPVVLGILINIQTALQSIAISNGYNYDMKISSVVLDPISLETVGATDVPFIVVDEEPGEGTNDFSGSRPVQIKNDFTVRLRCRVDANGDDLSRKKTAAWMLYADIEKVLVADPQRGGVALYTYVQWPSFWFGMPSENQVYIEVPVRITLNRVYGIP